MKAKTIKAVLRKKIDEWALTVEDLAVRELIQKNTIVTGGAIASMLLKEPVNDYDIYFRNHATTLAVAEYYVKRFHPTNRKGIPCNISISDKDSRITIVIKSAGIASEEGTEKPYEYFESRQEGEAGNYVAEIMDDPGDIQDAYEQTKEAVLESEEDGKPPYRPVFLSTNAITLSHKLQIVLRFYGEPEEIHENYDFVHCTNHWKSWDNELILRADALESLLTKELRYVGSKYPICSIIRLRKFIKRGWSVNAGQILKMVMQASELDLKNIEVLRDQLTGVDAAYFFEVIQKVREKDPEKVNSAYLIEIIDRMF